MGSVGNGNTQDTFKYERSSDIKAWSDKEDERTRATSDMVIEYLNRGGFGEYYEEENLDIVDTIEIGSEYGFRDGTEITIAKNRVVYASNWDENDNRVKRGKAITGTTFYTVAIDGEVLDDSHPMYKTVADAKHDIALNLDYYKQREAYDKAKKRG